jgi:hypothetical protein
MDTTEVKDLLAQALDSSQRGLILDLLQSYRHDVAVGTTAGYGQPLEDELADADTLISYFE